MNHLTHDSAHSKSKLAGSSRQDDNEQSHTCSDGISQRNASAQGHACSASLSQKNTNAQGQTSSLGKSRQRSLVSIPSHIAIWFGAAVSVAEILTGTLIAPLGLVSGFAAIILGHIIGCIPLLLVAYIGAKTGLSAMSGIALSYGRLGSRFFAAANILQLIGWTAVMIAGGAAAAFSVANLSGSWVWALCIAALIVVWVLLGVEKLVLLNAISVALLFGMTVVLTIFLLNGGSLGLNEASFGWLGAQHGTDMLSDTSMRASEEAVEQAPISFGAAVELSAAMPLSWLPLIADYSRKTDKPMAASIASVGTYCLASSWMFFIGVVAVLSLGTFDVISILPGLGIGAIAIIAVLLSTVTTTFLDAHSAGISVESISSHIPSKLAAIIALALGTTIAIFVPVARYEDFLYFIGSVFAPMAAVFIADYFLRKNLGTTKASSAINILIWLSGFVLYRLALGWETAFGITLPIMVICVALRLAIHFIERIIHRKISDAAKKT